MDQPKFDMRAMPLVAQWNNALLEAVRGDAADELAGLGRWWLDREGGRIALSTVAARLLGEQHLVVDTGLACVDPEDRERVQAALAGAGAGGAAADCEFRVRRAGREQVWLRLQGLACGGGGTLASGILTDVTTAKHAQTRERFNFAFTRYLLGTDSIDAAVAQILRLVCEELGWEWGAYWALEPTALAPVDTPGVLRCRYSWHAPRSALTPFRRASEALALHPGEGMIGRVWVDGEARWIEDAPSHPELVRAQFAHACGLQSAYFFPVVFTDADGRVQHPGVLEFFSDLQRQHDALLPSLATSIGAMIGQAVERIAQQERVRVQAQTDEMTGLANRAHFHARVDARCRRAGPDGTFGVMFIDLDQFKPINDAFGHEAGNEVLRAFAARLQALAPDGWTVGRLGGDEFALLSPPGTGAIALDRVAHDVLQAARGRFAYGEHRLAVSASIGISRYPDHGASTRELLHAADSAMYLSKHRGRNLATCFTGNSTLQQIEVARQLTLQSELHYAAARGELFLEYQPICDTSDTDADGSALRIVAAEALVRWRRPDGEIVPPGVFIPIAEKSRLIVDIGRWVLKQVCLDLPRLHACGLPGLRVHVNMAAPEFLDVELPDELDAILSAAGVDPRDICLELTESVVMQHAGTSIPIMRELQRRGFEIGLDDFGMGYSSLSMLKELPLATLKIDRAFMAGVPYDRDDNAIVRAIIDLGRHRRLQVIAEGVETDAQLSYLRQFGCNLAQGWLPGRPMPLERLLARGAARG
jgi:diguanylate cyclase (GGDEF)-like protein